MILFISMDLFNCTNQSKLMKILKCAEKLLYTTLFWHISNQIFELANYEQLKILVYHCRKLPKESIVENVSKLLRNSLSKMSKNLQLHVQLKDYIFSCTSSFLRAIRKLQGWVSGKLCRPLYLNFYLVIRYQKGIIGTSSFCLPPSTTALELWIIVNIKYANLQMTNNI